MRRRLPQNHSRSGLSLIELLVAMSIIAILCGMSWMMLGRTGETAKISATRTTLLKLQSMLNVRYKEFDQTVEAQVAKHMQADQSTDVKLQLNWFNIPGAAADFTRNPSLAAVTPNLRNVVVMNDRYVGLFPQRVADFNGLDGTAGTADDSPMLAAWTAAGTGPGTHTADTESSELLYLMLTAEMRQLAKSRGPNLQVLDSIPGRHIGDTDNDGRKEFLDDFGKPLRFYNAPTRLIRPGGFGTIPTAAQYGLAAIFIPQIPKRPTDAINQRDGFNMDPMDNIGTQLTVSTKTPVVTIRDAFETTFHTPGTFFKPMIVSCGPDEALGLGEPTLATPDRLGGVVDADAAADNITSLQRAGR